MIDRLAVSPDWSATSLNKLTPLKQGELHIWCLPLELNQAQIAVAENWLSDIQRDKYLRRRTPALQNAYLAGRYYLLTLLGHYAGCEPEDVKLSYTSLNKPYLSDKNQNIHFNFTDTTIPTNLSQTLPEQQRSVALLGFSCSGEIGVDIESMSRTGGFEKIVEKRFSASEQALVTNSDGQVDNALFSAIWTRKEASGKATGQGINFKMNQRNLVHPDHDRDDLAHLNYVDEKQRPWRLIQLNLGQDLIGCVVHAGDQALSINAFNRLET